LPHNWILWVADITYGSDFNHCDVTGPQGYQIWSTNAKYQPLAHYAVHCHSSLQGQQCWYQWKAGMWLPVYE